MRKIRILTVLLSLFLFALGFSACGSSAETSFTIPISMDYEEYTEMTSQYAEGNQHHFGDDIFDETEFEKSSFTINVTDLVRNGEVATFSGDGSFSVCTGKYPYTFKDATLKAYELSDGRYFYDGQFETEFSNIHEETAIANIGVSFLEDYSKGIATIGVRSQNWDNEALLHYGDIFVESQEAFYLEMQDYQGGSFEEDDDGFYDDLDFGEFEPEDWTDPNTDTE